MLLSNMSHVKIEIENVKTYEEYVEDKYSIEMLVWNLQNRDKMYHNLSFC